MNDHDISIFSGTATPVLANDIAQHLDETLGNVIVSSFSDGETQVEIGENVRGKNVYIIQSTCSPSNHTIMELLIMIDAFRRAAANEIVAVMPYYGYARQDRRPGYSRVPITAKLVAGQLGLAGATNVVTVDLHSEQIQGFFDMPFINATAMKLMAEDINHHYTNDDNQLVMVSPDVGGTARTRALAKRIGDGNVDLAIIDKRRPRANVSEVMNIVGDVVGRTCIIVDDMIDTAGTLCKAATALKENGAAKVIAYSTHPVLSGNAIDTVTVSALDEIVVTDTIPLKPEARACERFRVLSTARLLADTIHRIQYNKSVSTLYTR